MNKTRCVLTLAIICASGGASAAPDHRAEEPRGYAAIDEEEQTVAFCGTSDHRIGVHYTVREDIGDLYYIEERGAGPQGILDIPGTGMPPGFSETYAGLYSPTGKRSGGVYAALVNEYCSDIRAADLELFLKAGDQHFSASPAALETCRALTFIDDFYGPKGTKGLLCTRRNMLLLVTARGHVGETDPSGRLSDIAEAYFLSFDEKRARVKAAQCLRKKEKTHCRPRPAAK